MSTINKIFTRYFRITSGPLMDKVRELEDANAVAIRKVQAFITEIGANNLLRFSDGRLSGFVFDAPPDQLVWRTPNRFGAYWPRNNTTAGRAMLARITALPLVVHIERALETVGLPYEIPVLIDLRCGYKPTLCGKTRLGVLFVTVPWRLVSPDEIAEYKSKKASGLHFSIEMDHLCWMPSAEMEEINGWEMEKEIADLNANMGRAAA